MTLRHPRTRPLGIAMTTLTLGACSADAQRPRPSQLGTVMQEVAGTRIEIVYRRPVARGRELFGALVPWGRVWTPSADSAARITLSGPMEIDGQRLEAGSYSIWTIPDSSSWTVIFNAQAAAFHLRYPDGQDKLRLEVAPHAAGDYVETLSFTFPMVDADSALLELHWGRTVIPLKLKRVPPTPCRPRRNATRPSSFLP